MWTQLADLANKAANEASAAVSTLSLDNLSLDNLQAENEAKVKETQGGGNVSVSSVAKPALVAEPAPTSSPPTSTIDTIDNEELPSSPVKKPEPTPDTTPAPTTTPNPIQIPIPIPIPPQQPKQSQSQISLLTQQIKTLTQTNQMNQLNNSALQTDLQSQSSKIKSLSSQLLNAQAEINSLNKTASFDSSNSTLALKSLTEAHTILQRHYAEIETTNSTLAEKHDNLKERAKAIATEVKDRRAEVKSLKETIESSIPAAAKSNIRISELEAIVKELKRLRGDELETLKTVQEENAKLVLKNQKFGLAEKKESDVESEKITELESRFEQYKEKAQSALAKSNQKFIQEQTAREAAEKNLSAQKESLHEINKLEEQTCSLSNNIQQLQHTITSLTTELADAKHQVDQTSQQLADSRDAQTSLDHQLSASLTDVQSRGSEIESLKNLLEEFKKERCANEAKLKEVSDEIRMRLEGELRERDIELDGLRQVVATAPPSATNDNDKDNAVLSNNLRAKIEQLEIQLAEGKIQAASSAPPPSSTSSSSQPLFYSMQKEAELRATQDEISRLASIIGDSEFAAQEAVEHSEILQRKIDEMDAKLKRAERSFGVGGEEGQVNNEYLKNVIMMFLTAGTHAEKIQLLPVLEMVLCLTDSEAVAARAGINSSLGLRGAGGALLDGAANARENESDSLMGGLLGGVGRLLGSPGPRGTNPNDERRAS